MTEAKFSPGTDVEISLDEAPEIWYSATVIKETQDGSKYVVKYKRASVGPLTMIVDSFHIRPSPPVCVNTAFQLLEKVDAFINNGWSSGIVTKILSGGRYIVYFKHTRKEKELKHSFLRLPMVHIDGKWVSSSKDEAMISKPQVNNNVNHGDNGEILLPPESSSDLKVRKEGRNGQQEQALPSGKVSNDARSERSMGINGVTKCEPLHSFSQEQKTESAPKELQSCETQMTPTQKLDNVSLNTSMEESEYRNQTRPSSASSKRMLENFESFDSPTNKETPPLKIKRRGPGRPPKSVSRSPSASVSGATAKQKSVTDSIQSCAQKPIVISLPCYNNSQWNSLQAQSNGELPKHIVAEVQEEKKQLPNAVNDRSSGKNVYRGKPVTPDAKGLRNEGITPKRKRGRPFGSLSAAKRKLNESDGALTFSYSTQRRSTRERKEVYKSAIGTLKPKKKLKTTTEIKSSIQETEPNLKEKADGVTTYTIRGSIEQDSHEVSGNVSDADVPLSAWLCEANSLPNSKKLHPGGNDSQCGNLDPQTGQISSGKSNKESTSGGGSDVDLAQSASQNEDTTTQRDEKMVRADANSLPFIKTSPIWKVIESMEVFKQIPQNPHFQPLYNTKEHRREGLAICSMVTFSRLVEDLSKVKFDDPINIIEGGMETLSDLESQGFSVELIRSRMRTLLSIKRKYDPFDSLAKEIAEEEKKRDGIDQELDEIDKKIAELCEQRALVVQEREKKESKIGGLQLSFESVREALGKARSEFERLANAPW